MDDRKPDAELGPETGIRRTAADLTKLPAVDSTKVAAVDWTKLPAVDWPKLGISEAMVRAAQVPLPTSESLEVLKRATDSIADLRSFSDLAADALGVREAALAPMDYARLRSGEELAIEGVREEIAQLAQLVATQAAIAERQEAGIAAVLVQLQASAVSSDRASTRLERLTRALVFLTVVIAFLTAVLVVRPGA
jgi:hypothetical protein